MAVSHGGSGRYVSWLNGAYEGKGERARQGVDIRPATPNIFSGLKYVELILHYLFDSWEGNGITSWRGLEIFTIFLLLRSICVNTNITVVQSIIL